MSDPPLAATRSHSHQPTTAAIMSSVSRASAGEEHKESAAHPTEEINRKAARAAMLGHEEPSTEAKVGKKKEEESLGEKLSHLAVSAQSKLSSAVDALAHLADPLDQDELMKIDAL